LATVKYLLAVLLTFNAAAWAQADPGPAHYDGFAEPFGRVHARQKEREQAAVRLRLQANLTSANERREAQYAENRRRCEAALRVAALCGKFAGTFTCDVRGFKPVAVDAAVKHAAVNDGDRYRMERCALDAAGRDP
jgi:hypothetical protein